jgi:hypothetical protein
MTNAEQLDAEELRGYKVEAVDGHVGKVDKGTPSPASGYFVVSTGHIIGRKVVLPLSAIEQVDDEEHTVHLAISEEEVKAAPEYAEEDSATYFDKPF